MTLTQLARESFMTRLHLPAAVRAPFGSSMLIADPGNTGQETVARGAHWNRQRTDFSFLPLDLTPSAHEHNKRAAVRLCSSC